MRRCAMWASVVAVGLVAGASLLGLTADRADGQEKKKTAKTAAAKPLANTSGLDTKFNLMQSDFVKETEKLANEYYDAGHYDKAKILLRTVLTLDPKRPGVDAKIKYIDEKVLTAHEVDFDIEADGAWHNTNISVAKDEPIRLAVKGTYKLILNATIGPEGVASKDPKTDMVAGIPMGALMGIVITGDKDKRGTPFTIGDGQDFTPKETGMLFMRVNCPLENKNVGKLKISMSGNLRTP